MKTAYFIYTKYYDFEQGKLTVGGAQTYLTALYNVFLELGYICKIYQAGESNEKVNLNDVEIVQCGGCSLKTLREKSVTMVKKIMESYNDDEDILVFMANELASENIASRSIAIQHGISWDSLYNGNLSKIRNIYHFTRKAMDAYRILENLKNVKKLVCVDHNFPNWLRSTAIVAPVSMEVIPNFAQIAPLYKKPDDVVNVVFARRFFDYRGTRIFAPAAASILKKHKNVCFTVAGSGPDEEFIHNMLDEFEGRVKYITYLADESMQVHSNQHIAIVPTIHSEGTSLSLLEAMSAQCAVICTDVGGLSNIVLDGYNGVFCEPNAESLASQIEKLIEDKNRTATMAANGYKTVAEAFSFDVWKKRWINVIKGIQ